MSKASEFRQMSDEQLAITLKETAEQLFRLRIQQQTETQSASSQKQKYRKIIARIKTVQHERAQTAK